MIHIGDEIKAFYAVESGKIRAYFVSSNVQKTEDNIKRLLEKLLIKKCKECVANDK